MNMNGNGRQWNGAHERRGFTLLEFLIALLIVSFGLLGIAAIIANSMKDNQSSYSRSQAVVLAGDIIDRMRANRIAADGSAMPPGIPVSPYNSPYNLDFGVAPSGGGVPQSDLEEWRAALAAVFPSGTGRVVVHPTNKKVTVTVQWDDSRGSQGSAAQQFTVETRL